MNLAAATIPQFQKMLKNLDVWLEKAVVHAKAKSFDPAILLQSRLAPDQYPLIRQIQAACDAAKLAAARLAAKDAPKHPDTEQTLDEIRARLHQVIEYLGTFSPGDFEGYESRMLTLPFLPGKAIGGEDYLVELAIPNFYFHVNAAYAILRHNGVDIGKNDYIGSLNVKDA